MINSGRATAKRGQGSHSLSLFFSARARLSACALGSVLVYWLGLAAPYPLVTLYNVPLLDLGKLAGYQPAQAGMFVLSFTLVFALYLAAFRTAQQMRDRRDLALVVGSALALCAVLLWVYPVGASDVYDSIFRAREWAVYNFNPLTVTPAQLSDDAWYPFVVWTWAPSAYGPLWSYLSFALYKLAGDDLLRNLLTFKLLASLSIVACALLIYATLRARGSDQAVAGVVLCAWNPLLLFESVVNGHNDSVMMALVLAGLWLYARRRHSSAVLACVLAGLIKLSALVLLPVLFAASIRRARSPLRFAAHATLLCVLSIAALYAPLWGGLDTLDGIALHNERFTSSLAAVTKLALEPVWGTATAETWTRILFGAVFAAAYLFLLWRTPDDERALYRRLFIVLALLLIVGTSWFQPWYVVWVVALAPLAGAQARRLSVAWSASALALYLLFDFVWVWYADFFNQGNELLINTAAAALWLAPLAMFLLWYLWPARRAGFRFGGV